VSPRKLISFGLPEISSQNHEQNEVKKMKKKKKFKFILVNKWFLFILIFYSFLFFALGILVIGHGLPKICLDSHLYSPKRLKEGNFFLILVPLWIIFIIIAMWKRGIIKR